MKSNVISINDNILACDFSTTMYHLNTRSSSLLRWHSRYIDQSGRKSSMREFVKRFAWAVKCCCSMLRARALSKQSKPDILCKWIAERSSWTSRRTSHIELTSIGFTLYVYSVCACVVDWAFIIIISIDIWKYQLDMNIFMCIHDSRFAVISAACPLRS